MIAHETAWQAATRLGLIHPTDPRYWSPTHTAANDHTPHTQ